MRVAVHHVRAFRLAALVASLAAPAVAFGQSNNECGPLNPELTLDNSVFAVNSSATTSVMLTDSLCGLRDGAGGGKDLFYRFTPPANGNYTFSTCGSSFDTVLSVHSGCPASSANTVGCNDDAGSLCPDSNRHSIISDLALTEGVQYYVRVAGYAPPIGSPASGFFQLLVTASIPVPANDECTSPASVSLGTNAGSNLGATGTDITPCGREDTADVWHSFTATDAGYYVFDTADPNSLLEDSTIALYAGCGGALLACNNDIAADNAVYQSRVGLQMAANQTVLVRIAGFGGSQNSYVLTISTGTAPAAPANDTCATAVAITGLEFTHTVDATAAGPDEDVGCNAEELPQTAAGVWYTYTAVGNVTIEMTETGLTDTIFALFTGDCAGGLTLQTCHDGTDPTTVALNDGERIYVLIGAWDHEVPGTPYTIQATVTEDSGACCVNDVCTTATRTACTAGGGSWSAAPCAAAGAPVTYGGATGVPTTVPDSFIGTPPAVQSTITVPDNVSIGAISVAVTLNHTSPADWLIRLTKGATTVDLVIPTGEGRLNPANGTYVFTDAASRTVMQAIAEDLSAPPGQYLAGTTDGAPVSLAQAFGGSSSQGDWQLTVQDVIGGFAGTLTNWTVTIDAVSPTACASPCRADFDGNGSVEVSDIFAFLSAWFNQAAGSDFNNSGATDVSDIFAFLSAWFAGCD